MTQLSLVMKAQAQAEAGLIVVAAIVVAVAIDPAAIVAVIIADPVTVAISRRRVVVRAVVVVLLAPAIVAVIVAMHAITAVAVAPCVGVGRCRRRGYGERTGTDHACKQEIASQFVVQHDTLPWSCCAPRLTDQRRRRTRPHAIGQVHIENGSAPIWF